MLQKALADEKPSVRQEAAISLGQIGDEKALILLEKLLVDKSESVRDSAIKSLCRINVEQALALLEKEMANKDAGVRGSMVKGLRIGSEKALVLLEKASVDVDEQVRVVAAQSLGRIGGERARDILLMHFALAKHQFIFDEIKSVLSANFADDPLVQKALKETPRPQLRP
jgi:HEAT repeat protein